MYGDALTTISRVKDRLQITVDTFDTVLTNLILSTTARIESLCNRRFIQATYEHELHDGSDIMGGGCRHYIVLKNGPVQTVSSIQWQAGTTLQPNWLDLYANLYTIDLANGIIHVPAGLPPGFQNIRVTYTGGDLPPAGPAVITRVCRSDIRAAPPAQARRA